MLWRYNFDHTKPTPTLPAQYRCPSWSWAKLDRAVEPPIEDSYHRILADVLDLDVDLEDEHNPFGRLRNARLTLRAWLIPFRWSTKPTPGFGKGYFVNAIHAAENLPVADNVLGPPRLATTMTLDHKNSTSEHQEALYFIPIVAEPYEEDVQGLVLCAIVGEGPAVYIRLGIAGLSGKDFEHVRAMPKRNITLV